MIVDHALLAGTALAAAGWLILLLAPGWAFGCDRIAGLAIPVALALAYAGIFPVLSFGAPGGYSSTAALLTLLGSDPRIVLAAWLHYLVFDLLIGGWILREARRRGIAHWQIVPALILCFLFGPVGWLVFTAQSALRRAKPTLNRP
jgi:hypothetical protein